MIRIFVFVALFLAGFQAFGQVFQGFSGSRADGMGGANVVLTDPFSSLNNIGALAWTDEKAIFTGYKNQFWIPELHTIFVGAIQPTKYGTATMTLSRFGGDLYHETLCGIGMGHKITNASIGLKINYLQVSAENLGVRQTWVGELGGRMLLRKDFAIGAHIYNFNRAKISDFQSERHPTLMKAGFSYFPRQNFTLNFQVDKDIDFDPTVRVGIEYQLVTSVILRTGLSTKPFLNTFGIGLKLWNFRFDYAFQSHTDLQPSNTFSMIYTPLKKTRK